MLSQFGEPVRGVSPYSDKLISEISRNDELEVRQIDYKSPFPSFLHPARAETAKNVGDLSWWNPFSWLRLANSNFDLIHIQHWLSPMSAYLLPLAWLSRKKGKKIVITVHNPEPHEHSFGFGLIESLLYRNVDAVIVHTGGGQSLINKCTKGNARVFVIPHGIDFKNQRIALDRNKSLNDLGLSEDGKYISIFGNLRGYKGIGLLLDVWDSVSSNSPEFKLIIGGRLWGGENFLSKIMANLLGLRKESDVIRKKLKNLIDKKKVIYFPGFLSDESIDSLIVASEFCVFPYERFESQSGAACRAVGMSTPVLVTNVGGLPELAIDESWVAERSSFESLSSKLKIKILDSNSCKINYDFEDRFKHMDWRNVAENTTHLYSYLLRI